MHEIVLSRNRFRDGAMVGRAMRAVKTLKKLDLSENEMTDLRQVRNLYSSVLTFWMRGQSIHDGHNGVPESRFSQQGEQG